MKFSLALFLSILLTLPSFVIAQKNDEELIEWNANRRLTWADYKSKPNPQSDAAASTTTTLIVEYNISSNHFGYKIQSLFSKSRSWGLYKTNYILSHEQGHFDIAEVFARKLHKKLTAYKFNPKTYKKDLKKIYEEVTDEKEETQNAYDEETKHSIIKSKQREWLTKIEEMLEEYEEWAEY